jgi:hypothetical protein
MVVFAAAAYTVPVLPVVVSILFLSLSVSDLTLLYSLCVLLFLGHNVPET